VPNLPRSLKSQQDGPEPAAGLHARKQQFVRNEIWDTAIRLFAEKGFDETTVDDIAQEAGVSRRSFFRYFSSKSDLMAQGILSYGVVLTEAINSCPRDCSFSEVLRETVLRVAQLAAAHPRTRTIMQIAAKYPAAREAQLSRMGEVQSKVVDVLAHRCRRKKGDLTPEVLAGLMMFMVDVTLRTWFENDRKDVPVIVEQVFGTLGGLVCDGSSRKQ
jgi:AcrR family transcriptional regulator